MKTLESLLRTKQTTRSGIKFIPDFRVAVQDKTKKGTHIIIHPSGYSGDTLDFFVNGNKLTPKGKI